MTNCRRFGSFCPEGAEDRAALCHGGRYEGRLYRECPSIRECKIATLRRKQDLLAQQNKQLEEEEETEEEEVEEGEEEEEAEEEEAPPAPPTKARDPAELFRTLFKAHEFKVPDLSELPTKLPSARPVVTPRPAAPPAATPPAPAAPTGPTVVGPATQFNQVVMPSSEAPPGMRSSYAAPTAGFAETAPTFTPREGESTWGRLWKNVVQGVIAAIGWALWNYCRTIDLFG